MEKVTIVVMPRDKYSTMETCLDAIIKNTPEPHELWVYSCATPPELEKRWRERYAGKAAFTFFPEYRNGAEMRTYAFERVETRLVVFVDNDVFVRPGWLAPLVKCQIETGAALVSPLILDRDDRIHTAGNDFYIVEKDGQTYASMELRYQFHKVTGRTNLTRRETAFGEMHCQLMLSEVGKKIRVFDPKLREYQEMDSGLTLAKNGYKMMFEPESVVYLFYEDKLSHAEDIPFHLWKWDMAAMHEGFAYFKAKWGLDINPGNSFDRYLRSVNRRVGALSRRFKAPWAVRLDGFIHRVKK